MSAVRLAATAPAALAVLAAGCLSKPGFECEIVPGSSQGGPRIGSQGGSPSGTADCGAGVIVGVELAMTLDPNPTFGQRTIVSVAPRCAEISNRDGVYVTGPIVTGTRIGGTQTRIDGPFTADCPANQIVTGLAAHLVNSGVGLFNSVQVECAPLYLTGARINSTTQLPVLPTGNQKSDAFARCADGLSLLRLRSISAVELDQLELECASTTCQLPP